MTTDKTKQLIRFLAARVPEHEERLEAMRNQGEALRKQHDLVWRVLLQSAATLGNSRGWQGLFGNPMLVELVRFDAVGSIKPRLRADYLEPILQTAGVRMPRIKAERLVANYDIIIEQGGEAAARKKALSLAGREAKIEFMKRFHGIGDKYARNIWMDLYDPDFHHAIAFDERLKKVAIGIGVTFGTYDAAEKFFVALAAKSGRLPWEVDRILYHFNDDAVRALDR